MSMETHRIFMEEAIREAAKAVMVEQKLDAVMNQMGVFVGGLDITDMVINKLKGAK